jgi:hypothetical protein
MSESNFPCYQHGGRFCCIGVFQIETVVYPSVAAFDVITCYYMALALTYGKYELVTAVFHER